MPKFWDIQANLSVEPSHIYILSIYLYIYILSILFIGHKNCVKSTHISYNILWWRGLQLLGNPEQTGQVIQTNYCTPHVTNSPCSDTQTGQSKNVFASSPTPSLVIKFSGPEPSPTEMHGQTQSFEWHEINSQLCRHNSIGNDKPSSPRY